MASPDRVIGQNETPKPHFRFLELSIPAEMPFDQAYEFAAKVTQAAWEAPIGGAMFQRQPTEADPDRVVFFALVTKPITDLRPDEQLSLTELESRQLVRNHYKGVLDSPILPQA